MRVQESTLRIKDSKNSIKNFEFLQKFRDKFVNYELIIQGYAKIGFTSSDYACSSILKEAGVLARTRKVGLWLPTPTRFPTVTPGPPPTPDPSKCDPRYPSVCIQKTNKDLNCSDIPYYDFWVGKSDPHGFDGNNNGWGCESSDW